LNHLTVPVAKTDSFHLCSRRVRPDALHPHVYKS
jgi:hypothetical protein